MRRFNRIEGISDARRIPILGKIRLGYKKVSKRTGNEYSEDCDHFVLPPAFPELAEIYGKHPISLPVMFPVNDETVVFSQNFIWWGSSGIKCTGNNEIAEKLIKTDDNGKRITKEVKCKGENCPDFGDVITEKGKKTRRCGARASLVIVLPRYNMTAAWQIDTGSINSIININTTLANLKSPKQFGRFDNLLNERLESILDLRRVPQQTYGSGGKDKPHHPLMLVLKLGAKDLLAQRDKIALPFLGGEAIVDEPIDENPLDSEQEAVPEGDPPNTADQEIAEPASEMPESSDPPPETEPPKPPKAKKGLTKQRQVQESTLGGFLDKLFTPEEVDARQNFCGNFGGPEVEDIGDDTIDLAIAAAAAKVRQLTSGDQDNLWEEK